MLDYLIVGSGLAGMALTETLRREGCSLRVYDDASQQASRVAGGLYNPVVLKRFTLAWEGSRLMAFSLPFYQQLEREWAISIDKKKPVFRRLASAEEQNAWFEAADRPGLSEFLEPGIVRNENPALEAPYGFGRVNNTGRIATSTLLNAFSEQLRKQGLLDTAAFDHASLAFEDGHVRYGDLTARRVVFCEGFGMMGNPFFNYLPLQGTKGELLTIRAPELREDRIVKSGAFFIPLGHDRYRVGATYAWNDYTQAPTREAREALLGQLRKFVRCEFEVEGQVAGIRPTVPDRRPLVGRHPEHPELFVLNGLGSRGVLIAPYAAYCLARFMQGGHSLPPEMDVTRYRSHFGKEGRGLAGNR